jgi:hypothetical protein
MSPPYCLALATLFAAAAAATPPPTPVATEVHIPERFAAAEFTQERRIAALDRPLTSHGSVLLADEGFVWKQHQPYQVSLSFDGVSIVETTTVGEREVTTTVRDPITNHLTRTLFQLMTGSWQKMQSSFEINPLPAPGDGGWLLELKPRDETVRGVIPRIVLSGTRYVDTILIEEGGENSTRIELRNQRLQE